MTQRPPPSGPVKPLLLNSDSAVAKSNTDKWSMPSAEVRGAMSNKTLMHPEPMRTSDVQIPQTAEQ